MRDSLTAGKKPDIRPKIRHAVKATANTLKSNENENGTLF